MVIAMLLLTSLSFQPLYLIKALVEYILLFIKVLYKSLSYFFLQYLVTDIVRRIYYSDKIYTIFETDQRSVALYSCSVPHLEATLFIDISDNPAFAMCV
ncbi:hypothetical protein BV210_18465 (plasmid) [Halorientalis sp. IM1011]|nr:hypothetical protein BV210_18465 [Halorientalis sp. IM1011]